MFPLQSPSKYFNRNVESGDVMQRTCENTDCKFRILGASVERAQVRTVAGLDCLHFRPLGASKYSVFKVPPPPHTAARNRVLSCMQIWSGPIHHKFHEYLLSELHQRICWHREKKRGGEIISLKVFITRTYLIACCCLLI